MSTTLHIDGSQGEGGGQILRSSLGLSLASGTPFVLTRIRAGRKKPGLLRQHLCAVLAAAELCGAAVEGARLRSDHLSFRPGSLRSGQFRFNIGSAGSTVLVLQALLPAFLKPQAPAMGDTHLLIEGGTHNPFAPPYGFLEYAFLPLLRSMGVPMDCALRKPGFFPAGGGQIEVWIKPTSGLRPLDLCRRGPLQQIFVRILSAHLPENVARREAKVLQKRLNLPSSAIEILDFPDSPGPGNIIEVHVHSEQIQEVFCSVGNKSLRAEAVASRAAAQVRNYLASQAPVGPHLADQLLIPLALAGKGRFCTMPPSSHFRTNMEIIKLFTGVEFVPREIQPGMWEISIKQ